mgnify:CR=1 FL=1
MPYLNVRLSLPESAELAERVAAILMRHTTGLLGKKAEVTAITLDFVPPTRWFVGGERLDGARAVTFQLDIKVTDGTNTKAEKSRYIEAVFADFDALFGPIAPASYIVIHDLRADAWGYQGRTQEYRFVQARGL